VNDIEKKRLYRGKGGEHMRNAVCRFIETVSLSKLELSFAIHKRYMDTIDECIKNSLEHVQDSAKSCFDVFSNQYHTNENKIHNIYLQNMIKKCTSDPNFAIKRGYTRALSSWSELYISQNMDSI